MHFSKFIIHLSLLYDLTSFFVVVDDDDEIQIERWMHLAQKSHFNFLFVWVCHTAVYLLDSTYTLTQTHITNPPYKRCDNFPGQVQLLKKVKPNGFV